MGEDGPLAGIRVLEHAGWGGAFAGRLLADAGADVVRIVPVSGDFLDREPPFFGDTHVSIQAAWYNAGKRVISLDLGSSTDRGRFLELVAGCDILIEDWTPGNAPLAAAELAAANPRLVHVSVTPFGQDGPWASYRSNDLVQNALGGPASVTGSADTPPLNGYGNQTHHTAGFYAAICALAALRAAESTGEAQHVDLSAHEAVVSCTEQVLMQWFFPTGGAWKSRIAPRQGSLHWTGAYAVYPDRHGQGFQVTAALNFDRVVLPWLESEGAADDLADKEKYPDLIALVKDFPHVMDVLRRWIATKDAEVLFYEAQRRHQPWAMVCDIPAVVKSPQIAARGWLTQREVPGFGPIRFPGRLFRTSADGPAPGLPQAATIASVGWEPRSLGRPDNSSVNPSRPLEGIRVLDFTHVLAGPFGTRVLGDLGADVIKVGTAARSGGANNPGHPYYVSWNRNKRSININMRSEQGREIARRLALECDVIIENFSAGVLARWGLDRASLATKNPGVSVIAMNGMGTSGPWKDFVTFAPTVHALVGLTYLTNPPGQQLLGYGFSLTDHLSGLAGALAAVEAVEYRRRTGQGLDIDLAQYELGLGIMAPAIIHHLANGEDPQPVGNWHPWDAWAPHGIYPCDGDDAWVAIAVRGDEEWRAFCEVIGQRALANDPRFATHAARVERRVAIDIIISNWTRHRDPYTVMDACQRNGITAGAVQDASDLTERDAQLKARRFFGTTTCERWGEYGIDRFPARFNGQRPAVYESVHELGADTFDVLQGVLGLSDAEIAELVACGALT